MGRLVFTLSLALLPLLFGGCRNRGCYPGGCLGSLGSSPTIAAPSTYSLRIPNLANQNYYTPAAQPAANPVSGNGWTTQGGTPVSLQQPATGWQLPGTQGGWNGAAASQNNGFPIGAGQGMVANQQVVASPTAWPGGGSRVISPDFATTRIDERFDPTRMPVADASGATSPSPFNQMPQGNRLANATMPTMQNPGFTIPNAVQPSNAGGAQWNFASGQPAPQPQQPQWILAESSTRDLSRDPNFQSGWRDGSTQQGVINR